MDDVGEVATDEIGDVAEDRRGEGIDVGDAEIFVDEVDAERRMSEQAFDLSHAARRRLHEPGRGSIALRHGPADRGP